jgi:hypothetical protein
VRRKKVVLRRPEPAWDEWVSPDPSFGTRNTPNHSSMQEAISRRAYSYWEARGFQGGSANEDWLRAEAEIQLEGSANAIMRLDRSHLQ